VKIGILFGGSSFEHEISIVSAITMQKVLKNTNLVNIFIDANRGFYLIDFKDMKSTTFSSGTYKKSPKLELTQGKFIHRGFMKSRDIVVDGVLNLVHGRDGEDGKLASLLEFYNIPYISPRIEASVLSYNKLFTKLYAKSINIPTLPYELLQKGDPHEIQMPFPIIIKPSRLGSSIGVSIVKEKSELDYALDVAFEYDDLLLIEPFMSGIKEYNQAGCYTDKWELSIIEEPQKEEFLDFEKKYMDFSRNHKAKDAPIPSDLADKIQNAFKAIYGSMFHGSIIRCDFFEKDGEIYLNEINPIPGSMANYLFEDFESMIQRVIKNLPNERDIVIDYTYINSIKNAKGKA